MRRTLVSFAVLSTLVLTGCGPDGGSGDDPAAGASVAASAAGTGDSSGADTSGGEAGDCLTGRWSVDVADLASQVAAQNPMGDATASSEGSITLEFGDTLTITYDHTAIIVTMPVGDSATVMRETLSGTAESGDYTVENGKVTGTTGRNDVEMKLTAKVNGVEVPMDGITPGGELDLAATPLDYTCSGNTATLTNPLYTWHLTRL